MRYRISESNEWQQDGSPIEFPILGIVFDMKLNCLLKIGNIEYVKRWYDISMRKHIENGLEDIFNDMVLIELPPEKSLIKEVNKMISTAGYIGIWYKKYIKRLRKDE